jgi:hypothetical protein
MNDIDPDNNTSNAFSLRASLIEQGVTDEGELRTCLNQAYEVLKAMPFIRASAFRVTEEISE